MRMKIKQETTVAMDPYWDHVFEIPYDCDTVLGSGERLYEGISSPPRRRLVDQRRIETLGTSFDRR